MQRILSRLPVGGGISDVGTERGGGVARKCYAVVRQAVIFNNACERYDGCPWDVQAAAPPLALLASLAWLAGHEVPHSVHRTLIRWLHGYGIREIGTE